MKFFFLNLFNLCCYLFLELSFGVIVIVINHKCTGSKKWPFKCVWSYLMNYPQLSIKQNDISLASSFLEPILGIKFAAFWNQFCSLFSLIKIYDILTASRATQIISWNTFFVCLCLCIIWQKNQNISPLPCISLVFGVFCPFFRQI